MPWQLCVCIIFTVISNNVLFVKRDIKYEIATSKALSLGWNNYREIMTKKKTRNTDQISHYYVFSPL